MENLISTSLAIIPRKISECLTYVLKTTNFRE